MRNCNKLNIYYKRKLRNDSIKRFKKYICEANLEIVKHGLVIHSWGNVSGREPETGYIVIKPSGVSYNRMKESDMVVLDISGNIIEGKWKPSTDTPTHLLLYKSWPSVGGIVHTHSTYATAWSQAGRGIPALGTTHADCFYGEVPCTRELTTSEIKNDYEANTGRVIIERLMKNDPFNMPAVLVNNHGPFVWGKDADEAVYNAVTLEEVAKIAFYTMLIGKSEPIEQELLDKHFFRKHGTDSYYGQ
ncbi:MAG TPA: L-ribulose-5-phosphate 4-epimerase [Bacteroidales bacterium]|nr:L-ribulose-5-phosphate 4-epimerase [Bacteroidales bacterium]